MKTKILAWISAAFALSVAALALLKGQRDRARDEVERAKRQVKVRDIVREEEKAIEKDRAEVRQKHQEVQQKNEERPEGERPTGSFRRR